MPETRGNGHENQVMLTPQPYRHIWIITGPAGCGKSTVAQFLAQQLSLPYIEGDEVRLQRRCLLCHMY